MAARRQASPLLRATHAPGLDATPWEVEDSAQSSPRDATRDVIDAAIEHKLEEQLAAAGRGSMQGLPYDLWLALEERTELYEAVRDRGQLGALLHY